MTEPLVSIIVPHYQTPELAKLCLRSIRKFTKDIPYEVIVVDNASKDGASLDYLRSVDWIRLIERHGNLAQASAAHREAVEVGIDAARAQFLLTVHTDTVPVREDWLQYHLQPLLDNEKIAAIGTDKLNLRPRYQDWLRVVEDWATWWKRWRPVRMNNRHPYIRSHCALYRRSILETHGIRYNDIPTLTAGQGVHQQLVRLGYECRLLRPRDVIQRVVHLEHATALMVPDFHPSLRKMLLQRGLRRIHGFLNRPEVKQILADESLDHAPITASRAA
jgi:GT2 family glycosyltransferase